MDKLNNLLWKDQAVICLTFDVDWASEEALKYCFNIIEEYEFKTTFFLTHRSEFILDLVNKEHIDCGIHPNFLDNSSQGSNYNEVIDYCVDLLPEAQSFRCHRYFDGNDITQNLLERGYKYDSNLCTLLDRVDPFIHRSGLVRFPIFFEDGAYLLHKKNLSFQKNEQSLFYKEGLMVLNIHPMHMAINSPSLDYMKKIKNNLTREEWNNLDYKLLKEISYKGPGIRDFIMELFKFIKKENIKTYSLDELYKITTR